MPDIKLVLNLLEKIDVKLDKLDVRVDHIDITLAKQEISLDDHIRRTELLETWSRLQDNEIAVVSSFMDNAKGAMKLSAAVGSILLVLIAIYSAVK